jgi:hypothetical protein
VWLREKGWTRVDPTSAVMPARIEQGTAAALTPEERETLFSNPYLGPLGKYWKKFLFGWDLVNNRWQKWVLGYDYFRQQMLYETFGMDAAGWKTAGRVLLVVAGLIALYGVFFLFRHRKRKALRLDSVQRIYYKFCRRLSEVGIDRSPHQGPVAFAKTVTRRRPDLSDIVQRVTEDYVALRYASSDPENHLPRLRKAVRKFRPKQTSAQGSP